MTTTAPESRLSAANPLLTLDENDWDSLEERLAERVERWAQLRFVPSGYGWARPSTVCLLRSFFVLDVTDLAYVPKGCRCRICTPRHPDTFMPCTVRLVAALASCMWLYVDELAARRLVAVYDVKIEE